MAYCSFIKLLREIYIGMSNLKQEICYFASDY
jgi:hypothetical protein